MANYSQAHLFFHSMGIPRAMVFSSITLLIYYRVTMLWASLRLRKPRSQRTASAGSKPFTALMR